jgi:hypothetical protein
MRTENKEEEKKDGSQVFLLLLHIVIDYNKRKLFIAELSVYSCLCDNKSKEEGFLTVN